MDVDRSSAVEPAKSMFELKVQIRRAIEAAGIPYTYVSSNNFAGYFLPTFSQPGVTAPPRDKVVILGDGTAKGNLFLGFSMLYDLYPFSLLISMLVPKRFKFYILYLFSGKS